MKATHAVVAAEVGFMEIPAVEPATELTVQLELDLCFPPAFLLFSLFVLLSCPFPLSPLSIVLSGSQELLTSGLLTKYKVWAYAHA